MGHRATWDVELRKIPESSWPVDEILPVKNWAVNKPSEDASLNIYTDGSKIGERSGMGWAATAGDTVVMEDAAFLGDTSVFNAELTAMQSSLLWVKENVHKIKNCHEGITIYSDSQSGIQSLFAPFIKSKLVQDVAILLQDVKKHVDIGIKWIRGHDNNTGNELADMLAKKGTEEGGKLSTPLSQYREI